MDFNIGDRVRFDLSRVVDGTNKTRRWLIPFTDKECVVVGLSYELHETNEWTAYDYTYDLWVQEGQALHRVNGYFLQYCGALTLEERLTHSSQEVRDSIDSKQFAEELDI